METFRVMHPVHVFGIHVSTFPSGISEAFNLLAQNLPKGYDRPYYGLSWMSGGKIIYHATTAELTPGEADEYPYNKHVIEPGTYACEIITGWRKKLIP